LASLVTQRLRQCFGVTVTALAASVIMDALCRSSPNLLSLPSWLETLLLILSMALLFANEGKQVSPDPNSNPIPNPTPNPNANDIAVANTNAHTNAHAHPIPNR